MHTCVRLGQSMTMSICSPVSCAKSHECGQNMDTNVHGVYRAASHLFIFTAMTHIQQTFKSYYRLRGLRQAESLDSIFINICPTWETWYDRDLGWWSSAAEKHEEGWLNLQPNRITVLYTSTNGTFYLILDKRVPYKNEGHTFYLTTISFLFFFPSFYSLLFSLSTGCA